MPAASGSIGMSVWDIAASRSSISLAACSRCRSEEEGRTIASLIYTGEVYNFVELRDELKRLGHRFKSQSDTEVVLRGYLQWGDEVVERLNGMFAFAIWDVRSRRAVSGSRPHGREAAVLLPHRGRRAVRLRAESDPCASALCESRVNKDGFREILVLAKNPEATIYAGMHEVRPGQVVRVNRNGLTKRRYWMLTRART